MADTTRTQIILPRCRIMWQYLMAPRINEKTKEKSFECVGIFDTPDGIDLSAMTPEDQKRWKIAMTVAKELKAETYAKTGVPKNFLSPLKNGSEYNDENGGKYPYYEGKTIINLKSKEYPVGLRKALPGGGRAELTEKELYNGMWIMAEGSFFCWKYADKQGMSFGLNNVLKVGDDEVIVGSGMRDPDKAFDGIDITKEYGVKNESLFDKEDTAASVI